MAKNAVIGDQDLALPQTQVDPEVLQEEKNLARFSKSQEYKKLKEYLENRIKFFQHYLPDGEEIRYKADEKVGIQWVVANNIINEFRNVLDIYERAADAVDEAAKKDAE